MVSRLTTDDLCVLDDFLSAVIAPLISEAPQEPEGPEADLADYLRSLWEIAPERASLALDRALEILEDYRAGRGEATT